MTSLYVDYFFQIKMDTFDVPALTQRGKKVLLAFINPYWPTQHLFIFKQYDWLLQNLILFETILFIHKDDILQVYVLNKIAVITSILAVCNIRNCTAPRRSQKLPEL